MSNTKITALTELATIDDTSDVVAIADVSASTTKKLTWSTIRDAIATYVASLTQTLTNKTLTSPKINENVALTSTATELNFVDGVTSAIQTQLDSKGTGTVTSVSVTTANGVSGSVATATSTPAITLTLGAITPTTVNGNTVTTGTGTLTLGAGKTLTASNTLTLTATDGSTLSIGTGGTLGTAAYTASTAYATSTQGTTADNALPKAGGTMSGPITLGENTSIALDPAGSADGKYSGITVTGTAGTTLAFGDLVYLAVADSRWELTDADASATGGPVMVGMCVLAAAGDGSATNILLQGIIRADAKFPALTIGAPVYLGETAGAIQVAIPTGADNVIRVVGFAITADEIYFNPSQDHQISVA